MARRARESPPFSHSHPLWTACCPVLTYGPVFEADLDYCICSCLICVYRLQVFISQAPVSTSELFPPSSASDMSTVSVLALISGSARLTFLCHVQDPKPRCTKMCEGHTYSRLSVGQRVKLNTSSDSIGMCRGSFSFPLSTPLLDEGGPTSLTHGRKLDVGIVGQIGATAHLLRPLTRVQLKRAIHPVYGLHCNYTEVSSSPRVLCCFVPLVSTRTS